MLSRSSLGCVLGYCCGLEIRIGVLLIHKMYKAHVDSRARSGPRFEKRTGAPRKCVLLLLEAQRDESRVDGDVTPEKKKGSVY